MIIKALTSLVTRDADAFVNFIEHLQNSLDALVIRHAADIGKAQSYIDEIEEEAADEISRIEAEAAALVQEARDYAAHEVLVTKTEISKIKANAERVKAAVAAVSKL